MHATLIGSIPYSVVAAAAPEIPCVAVVVQQ